MDDEAGAENTELHDELGRCADRQGLMAQASHAKGATYEMPPRAMILQRYGLELPACETPEMWPRRESIFVRRPPELSSGDAAVLPVEAHRCQCKIWP